MTLRRPILGSLLAALAVAGGCEQQKVKPEPKFPFDLTVNVTTDESLPVAGAEIYVDSTLAGTTDPAGGLAGRLELYEGTEVRIDTRCPPGFIHGGTSKVVKAHRLASQAPGTSQAMPVHTECTPTHRKAAVVVRVKPVDVPTAPVRPGKKPVKPPVVARKAWLKLPILLDGHVVGQTDADGLAHLLLDVKDETSFELVLDTSAHPRLEPQNPITMLAVKHKDERFMVDQVFSEVPLPKKKPRPKAAPPPVDTRPTELRGIDPKPPAGRPKFSGG
jgi:hypothetical protein